MKAAAVRVGSVLAFGVLPVVVAVWMFVVAHPRVARGRLPPRALPRGATRPRRREPVPAAGHRPLRRAQLHLAAARGGFRRSAHGIAARGGRLGDRLPGHRVRAGVALGRRRPGLARLRGVRAVAADDRRDARVAPDAAALPARRARVALPGRPLRARRSRSGSAAQSSSSSGPSACGSPRSDVRERRSSRPSSPARRSSSSSRSRASPRTSRRWSTSGGHSITSATRPFGLLVQLGGAGLAGPRRDPAPRRCAARAVLAAGEPRARRRRRARALADRLDRLLRARGGTARRRPAEALARLARPARHLGADERRRETVCG